MDLLLVTGRTINQGLGKEMGKLSKEYMEGVAVCEMTPEDMKRLNIRDGGNVKVSTNFGSVVVKAEKSRRIQTPGIIFIPYGPWSNLLVNPETDGTGMPSLKGIPARVEPTDEEILEAKEILNRYYSYLKTQGGKS